MKFQMRQRDRRAVLGLLCALGLYLVLSFVALPAFDRLKGASQTAAEKEELLRKYLQAQQRKGNYQQLLAKARKSMTDSEARLIRGDNPSQASIELQRIVEESARKVAIEFSQRNISTAKKKDDFFNEIAMTMSFECTPNQLTTFLADIRNAEKFLTVRNAQVAPVEGADALPKKGEIKKLVRVTLTVAALLSSPVVLPAVPAQEKK